MVRRANCKKQLAGNGDYRIGKKTSSRPDKAPARPLDRELALHQSARARGRTRDTDASLERGAQLRALCASAGATKASTAATFGSRRCCAWYKPRARACWNGRQPGLRSRWTKVRGGSSPPARTSQAAVIAAVPSDEAGATATPLPRTSVSSTLPRAPSIASTR